MNIANDARSPFDEPAGKDAPDRRIGALISEFSSLGPLLARTDFIATFPRILMAWEMETYGLCPLPPQISVPPFRTRFFWSSRLANDPASKWIRDLVIGTYAELHHDADRMVERVLQAR